MNGDANAGLGCFFVLTGIALLLLALDAVPITKLLKDCPDE